MFDALYASAVGTKDWCMEKVTTWPPNLARKYIALGLWQNETLYTWLKRGAECFPNSIIADERECLTRHQFLERVDVIAAALARRGLSEGDHVILRMSNRIDGLATVFSCARIGVTPLLAIPELGPHELTSFVERIRARGIISTPDCPDGLDHLSRSLPVEFVTDTDSLLGDAGDLSASVSSRADAVGVFLVSGGTTGVPKVVPHVHRSWLYLGRCVAERCVFDPRTVYLVAMPLAHGWAMSNGVLAALGAGGSLVLAPSPAPTVVFDMIATYRVTHTGLIPPIVSVWIKAADGTRTDISSLKTVMIGGSSPSPELLLRAASALDCEVHQGFGMTEGLCGIQVPGLGRDEMLRDQGPPVSPYDEIRIVDDSGEDVETGIVGNLLTRGPYTTRGYYCDDSDGEPSFTADGWYRTGDLASVDDCGSIRLAGRRKEQINRGGEKVSEREVEYLLLRHPRVNAVAVVGAPDERYGEEVVAFVVGEAVSLAEMHSFLRSQGLANYKFPTTVHYIEDLPYTGIGRIDKKRLRVRASESQRRLL